MTGEGQARQTGVTAGRAGVDTACLLYAPGGGLPDPVQLAPELMRRVAGLRLISPPDDTLMTFRGAGQELRLAISARPRAAEHLAMAMSSPAAMLKSQPLPSLVSQHDRHVTCSVEGPEGQARLDLLFRVVQVLADLAPPLALHWSASDMLFTADEVLAGCRGGTGLAFALHPVPMTDPAAGAPYGLCVNGAERLGLPRVVVMPGEMPPVAALALAERFLAGLLADRDGAARPGQLVDDGLGTVFLTWLPASEDAPAGQVLMARSAPADAAALSGLTPLRAPMHEAAADPLAGARPPRPRRSRHGSLRANLIILGLGLLVMISTGRYVGNWIERESMALIVKPDGPAATSPTRAQP